MNEELQQPPVIDLEALLTPISEESPSGENQRYTGLYDEIAEARRADDPLTQGEWQSELKSADYRKVIDLATDALMNKTKDLQVAAWFSEALVKTYGFAGLRDSIKLLAGLQDRFWDSLHPEIDEGDMEGRANAISWFDTQVSLAIKMVPVTQGEGYGYAGWEDAKRFDIPEDLSAFSSEDQEKYRLMMEQVKRENRATADKWKKAKAQTRRLFCEQVNYVIEECWTELKELNRVIEEKYDRNQMPGLGQMNKSLDAVHTLVKKILADKRVEEPDPSDAEQTEGANGAGGESAGGRSGGAVSGRADALRKLSEIAAFFQRTEPHSPVAYLVQRAVRWGNMPLDSWLQDVIKDENVLSSIRETLGIGSGYSDYGSGSGYDSEYSSSESETSESTNSDW
jgi:type VI secretion system protein ImpA